MQESKDDKDFTDDKADPQAEKKQRVVASTVDLCAENKARVVTLDIRFCQTLCLLALVLL